MSAASPSPSKAKPARSMVMPSAPMTRPSVLQLRSATKVTLVPTVVLQAGGMLRVPVEAVASGTIAAATIWLMLTDPVTVAEAVDTGEMGPLAEELADVIYKALVGLIKYL